MIQTKGLSKVYPNGTVAINGLDLTIERGETVFIKGESGAGKTTLFKLIMGMEAPSSGSLLVDGHLMTNRSPKAIRSLRRGMGVVFQDFRLIKGRTARENVDMGMRVLGISSGTMRQRTTMYLEALGLQDKMDVRVESLSWGEQQRVVIARALARKPVLILADEPTGNLDRVSADRALNLLLSTKEEGSTVLVATHALDMLQTHPGRLITLESGMLTGDTQGRERAVHV